MIRRKAVVTDSNSY